jgi:hypothetical protein
MKGHCDRESAKTPCRGTYRERSVKAIGGDRAWPQTLRGREGTVVAGERLKAAGTVRSVDGVRGVVTMSDGRVVR